MSATPDNDLVADTAATPSGAPMSVAESATYDIGADELWHVVGDFYNVAGWMPGVAASTAHRESMTREVHIAGSPEAVVERLVDEGQMWQRYGLVSGPLPVRDYTARLEAAATGPAQTQVTWTATFTPVGPTAAARATVESVFRSALENLGRVLTRRASTTTTKDVFEAILHELTPRGVVEQSMFGQRGLMSGGHLFATTYHGGFAVRLIVGTPEFEAANSIEGAHIWNPTRGDKPFRDWVELPGDHATMWPDYALAALRRSATGRRPH